jgi:hypothetical protein
MSFGNWSTSKDVHSLPFCFPTVRIDSRPVGAERMPSSLRCTLLICSRAPVLGRFPRNCVAAGSLRCGHGGGFPPWMSRTRSGNRGTVSADRGFRAKSTSGRGRRWPANLPPVSPKKPSGLKPGGQPGNPPYLKNLVDAKRVAEFFFLFPIVVWHAAPRRPTHHARRSECEQRECEVRGTFKPSRGRLVLFPAGSDPSIPATNCAAEQALKTPIVNLLSAPITTRQAERPPRKRRRWWCRRAKCERSALSPTSAPTSAALSPAFSANPPQSRRR